MLLTRRPSFAVVIQKRRALVACEIAGSKVVTAQGPRFGGGGGGGRELRWGAAFLRPVDMAMSDSTCTRRWEAELQVLLICLVLRVAQGKLFRNCPSSAGLPPSLTIRGYAHLRLGVPDATEQTVVPGVNDTGTGVVFGTGIVVADPFRQGTSATSDLVGNIRGFGIYDDNAATNKYLSLSLTFLIEYQNVSGTVVVVGTRVSTDAARTLTVVGGTGDFALARGIATQTPVFTGPANDGTAAIVSVNEWRLTMIGEAYGPNLTYLALKLPSLVPLPDSAGKPV